MSSRNNTRAALASATALAGITVSDGKPATPPAVTTDASPLPADAQNTNIALPSKRALAAYAAGIEKANAGSDMLVAGIGMIAAAIVDYCINTLKWKPADAIRTGQANADDKKGALSAFHSSCVSVFYGARPSSGNAKMSMSEKHLASAEYKEFQRRQFHITNGADLAICLISDGCTMRDYDDKLGQWNLLGALYCEKGCKPADGKARYTMERCRAKSDYVPCKVGTEDTYMRRDRAHYMHEASLRHAILAQSVAKVTKREDAATRAPHHNTTVAPAAKVSPAVAADIARQVAGVIDAPTLVTPGTNAQPTPGYNAGAVTNGPGAITSGNTTTAPMDADTKATFAANILATRRAILALCEAPNVVSIAPEKFLARVSPTTLTSDAWSAWMDVVAMVRAWEMLHGATKAKVVSAPTSPAVSTEPTKIGDVVLSKPTKADKPAKVAA